MRAQLSFDDTRPDLADRIAAITQDRMPIRILLDGLQDQRNIGGLFRTADAARLAEIILYNCPIAFGSKNFKKTARSTLKYVPYRILPDNESLHRYAEAHTLVSLEHSSDSTSLADTLLDLPITLVLGNEKVGVSPALLALSKQAVHLPMLGIQSSLNVCTAGSIAIYDLLRRL